MLVRREGAGDAGVIRAVTAAAFALEDKGLPAEAPLVDELRASPAWIPGLSLVALDSAGDVAGHVVCARARVGSAPVLALGPLSVRPEWAPHFQVRTLTAYGRGVRGEFAFPEPFDRVLPPDSRQAPPRTGWSLTHGPSG